MATGEITSPQDAEYLPPESDVKKLTGWLKDQGFTIDHLAPDGIYATASTSKVAKSLAVDIVRVTRDGFTHNAARTAPSLPADLAKHVTAIGGLQPFLCAHRHSRLQTPKFGNRARLGRKTTGVTKTPPADDNVPPFMVSEILKAYDAEDLSETGDGQIIAILIDTFPDDDDVKAFWSKNGIPGNLARIEKINVKGGSLPPPAGEETLDVEWSSGIAQKARIRVYATGSLAFVDLDRALDEIIADVPKFAGLRQLSISLGLGETYLGGPTGEIATQHQKFLRLAAASVNVFVSSGEAGSNPDQTGHSSSGPAQAEYAASDSCVIGVGGTSLSLTSRGTVARETGWANGGGGVSKFFDQPSWQKAKGAPKSKKAPGAGCQPGGRPGNRRLSHSGGKGDPDRWHPLECTGLGGFCALCNEAREKAKKDPLPFLNPALYKLAGTSAFRDINAGSNGLYSAHTGFDLVTGLGVPSVKNLRQALLKV